MSTERPWKAVAGGVLNIIAGSLHLSGWLAVRAILNKLIATGYLGGDKPFISATNVSKLVMPLLVMAVIAIIGGIFALNKKFWGIALAGAICAIFSPATWILGVASTVIISIAKHEFHPALKSSGSI
jgi:hypothetical protein